MAEVALRAELLGKMYRIGSERERYQTLRDSLAQAVRRPLERIRHPGAATHSSEELWALRGLDLQVDSGEVVGVVGRNGSGKSTLLKVLSHITEPTEGRLQVRGRVASLLEVGTGFHAELTGRENIQLNGAILGMTRAEIKRKFDQIVEFSEIGRFLDTPVKRYSSGMYMRLAFAVAANLESDILAVDEVLAVGDAAFQKKCLGAMRDIGSGGRAVLFVSHNLVAVRTLCTRAILLDRGRLVADGTPSEVVSAYLSGTTDSVSERVWSDDETGAPGNELIRILRASVTPADNTAAEATIATPLVFSFEFRNLREGAHVNLSVSLFNEHGVEVFNSYPIAEPTWHGKPFPLGVFRSGFTVPAHLLNDGAYDVHLLVVHDENRIVLHCPELIRFTVAEADVRPGRYHGRWSGVVRPQLHWTTTFLDQDGDVDVPRA